MKKIFIIFSLFLSFITYAHSMTNMGIRKIQKDKNNIIYEFAYYYNGPIEKKYSEMWLSISKEKNEIFVSLNLKNKPMISFTIENDNITFMVNKEIVHLVLDKKFRIKRLYHIPEVSGIYYEDNIYIALFVYNKIIFHNDIINNPKSKFIENFFKLINKGRLAILDKYEYIDAMSEMDYTMQYTPNIINHIIKNIYQNDKEMKFKLDNNIIYAYPKNNYIVINIKRII